MHYQAKSPSGSLLSLSRVILQDLRVFLSVGFGDAVKLAKGRPDPGSTPEKLSI